ncbi:hypothetical protein [Kitasatospora sp. NPDC088548]|uniref:hypothetical protein n=1 Tax=Kitasatospora sp. NPDC088548 TaxID=3364075 RepID=UPI0037FC54AE
MSMLTFPEGEPPAGQALARVVAAIDTGDPELARARRGWVVWEIERSLYNPAQFFAPVEGYGQSAG